MPDLPSVGDRFRLARDVDRYPHFIAAEGAPGTVTDVTDGRVSLKVDTPLPGAEQWDNEVVWDTEAGDDFWGDVHREREQDHPETASTIERLADPPDLGL